MARKHAARRKGQPAPPAQPHNAGRAKASTPPTSTPAPAATTETTAPTVCPEADPHLADAANRAAELRDQTAADVARILADGEARATELLDDARTEAATITEAAIAEQSRLLAAAATDADRVRTEAATTAAADADQVHVAAETEAEQLLIDARRQADTVTATAAGEAEKVLADAKSTVEELLADARRQAQEVTTTAAAHADEVRTEAAQAAAKTLFDAETQRTELLAGAERTAVETRTRATTDAEHVLERAQGKAVEVGARAAAEAASAREQADREAAQVLEDAAREQEAARESAARVKKLAEEDTERLRATAAEDAERVTRAAREEAERIMAAARTRTETELKEAQERLEAARAREADAEVTLEAADDMVREAGARMARAMDRTERRIERKRLEEAARQERGAARDERKAKARQLRADARAGKPTRTERVKEFVKVNAERLMVVGPITAPMAVAWTGQAGFAEDILDWVVPFTILFAAAWELSTAFVGWMYHQARRGGDAGTLYRVSTWIFALGAAVMNFWHASGKPTPGSRVWDAKAEIWTEQMTYWHFTPKAVAFAAMSIVGMVLWELYASLIHRRTLREDGKVAKARPSIGAVRWIRYPVHSWTAWSLAITDASLTTLDRAWAAAATDLAVRETVRTAKGADRRAVRTGRALQRVVVPRVGAKAHGPEAIPSFLTITRTDRSGPGYGPAPVHPVQPEQHAVRSGPADRNPVHGAVRTAASPDRTGGPPLALEAGPAGPHWADQETSAGPDRTAKSVPAAHANSAGRVVTVRTAAPHSVVDGPARTADTAPVRTGAEAGPGRTRDSAPARTGPEQTAGTGPDRTGVGGPDWTVIELTDLERTALDRLRTANEALNRNNIARAVRAEGGTIATDRAGQIAVALKQHALL
ncbi:hypothetical protein OH797_39115 (plasmid) [Streptomyces anulatus]|uniref:hypothetical protein n=1 Tax=Streptomyces anulatus TaxID=1892 RepID=UPI002F90BDD3